MDIGRLKVLAGRRGRPLRKNTKCNLWPKRNFWSRSERNQGERRHGEFGEKMPYQSRSEQEKKHKESKGWSVRSVNQTSLPTEGEKRVIQQWGGSGGAISTALFCFVGNERGSIRKPGKAKKQKVLPGPSWHQVMQWKASRKEEKGGKKKKKRMMGHHYLAEKKRLNGWSKGPKNRGRSAPFKGRPRDLPL